MDYKEYLTLILQMVKRLDESDIVFLRQIYTILKRHEEKQASN